MRPSPMLIRCLLVWPLAAGAVVAQEPANAVLKRGLLYVHPVTLSDGFKVAVDEVRSLNAAPVPYDRLSPRTHYYVRIVPLKHIVNCKKQINPNAFLGAKPFVFVTSPQGVAGKRLLDIYKDLGYAPADVLNDHTHSLAGRADERGPPDLKEAAAVVFRFPSAVRDCSVRDGRLPDDWDRRVYVPTWDNVYALFARLAATAVVDAPRADEFQPERLFFRSTAEKTFVLNYPASRLKRRKKTSFATYQALMLAGGADWDYRKLLEDKLSIFPHFRGTGRTLNVFLDPYMTKADAGIFEYIGPNAKLKDLPEVAVIHLGTIKMEETYPAPKPKQSRG